MTTARLPASANVIFSYGNSVLLIKRSSKTKAWPNFWAFPGGKVDDDEFFRESAQREISEEIGVSFDDKAIKSETFVMNRTNQWTKIVYFCLLENWSGIPEIREKNLATDIAWFPISNLPEPIIPHHKVALEAIQKGIVYTEYNTTF